MAEPAPKLDEDYYKPGPRSRLKDMGGGAEGGGPSSKGAVAAAPDLVADEEPVTGPDLQALEGGRETSEAKRGHLKSAGGEKSDSPEKLADSEENGGTPTQHENQVGAGHTGSGKTSIKARFSKNKKRNAIVGGSIVTLIVGAVISFLVLLPAKLLGIMNNVDKYFMTTSQNALGKEQDRIVSNYIQKKVFPGLKTCKGTTIDASCRAIISPGDGIVSTLYNNFRTARLEQTLAKKYGIEFGYKNGNYYMRSARFSGIANMDDFASGSTRDFWDAKDLQRFGKASDFHTALNADVDKAIDQEMRPKQSFIRYKVRGFLAKKGILFKCVIACKARYDFADWKKDQKNAFKYAMSKLILNDRNTMVSLVIGCIWNKDPGCDTRNPKPKDAVNDPKTGMCGGWCGDNGAPKSQFSDEMIAKISALPIDGLDDAAKIATFKALYDEISASGFKQYMLQRVIRGTLSGYADAKGTQAADQLASRIAIESTRAITAIGFIVQAGVMINLVDYMADNLAAYGYQVNSTSMQQMYNLYRTYTDEVKSGNVDAAMVGSFVDSLGGTTDTAGDPSLGGTAEAEHTPLYNLLLGSGVAAGAPDYVCDRGSGNQPTPPTASEIVCPQMKVTAQSKFVGFVARMQTSVFWRSLSTIGGVANQLLDPVIGWITQGIGYLVKYTKYLAFPVECGALYIAHFFGGPNCSDLLSSAGNAAKQAANLALKWTGLKDDFANFFHDYLLPPDITSSNPSGGWNVDMAMGGADSLNSDISHNVLGGTKLSDQQAQDIHLAQLNNDNNLYKSQSFIARMFDTNEPNSLTTKVAMAMPSNGHSALRNMASFLTTSPLSKLSNSLASIFSVGHAHAAVLATDPFGISQYGYPLNNKIFTDDPEDYWNQNCIANGSTKLNAYNKAAADYAAGSTLTSNPEHLAENLPVPKSQDPYEGTEPCLLIQAAVGSLGAIYNPGLLTPDDLAQASTGSASGGGGAPDQGAGTPPPQWAACIAKYAPAFTPGPGVTIPPNAVPNDGQHQYFGQMANDGKSMHFTADQAAKDGHPNLGEGDYIWVKYRAPPGGGNTIWIPTFGC